MSSPFAWRPPGRRRIATSSTRTASAPTRFVRRIQVSMVSSPDDANVFIVVRRLACGTIDRRPIVMVEGEPATDDETGQWPWAIWEVDDTGGGVFCSYE